jgi:CIC family chloride channel protein
MPVIENSGVNANRLAQFAQRLPGRGRPIFLTCVFGLAAGLAAVAFQLAMNALYRLTFIRLSHQSVGYFLVGSLVVILFSSLVVGFLLNRFAPEASGSGIPQLKLAFWKDFGVVPWRVVWVKFVAGVLSIGGGCSLGREGPSVQLAVGILTRREAEAAIAEKRSPKLEPLVICLPHQTIRELQAKLIESTSLMTVILDQPGGRLLGLVTLHDLLRAEVAIASGTG